ncbi:uncharacterized protein LOC143281147 isoform X2 [Babylonia areolata]|uniref:uncharacterized protein LOC143281147 isoform X2 n=1 Tax=Babylonia areolata TaxID=304850 RepID=UPI003FD4A4A7
MVLSMAAEDDHNHQRLVIACGESGPEMEQTGEVDSITATSLPPPSPPSSHQRPGLDPCDDTDDVKTVFLTNGGAVADCAEPVRRTSPFNGSHSAALKEEPRDFAVYIKQEEELDAPLDFSIKRKDSPCDSVKEDCGSPSTTTTTTRPPPCSPFSSPSSRLSPDTNLHQTLSPSHHVNGDSSREEQGQSHSMFKSPSPNHVKSAAVSKLTSKLSSGSAAVGGLGVLSEEAGGVTPAALSAVMGQNGSLSPVPTLLGEARKLQAASGVKVQRPFKAYPKEVLRMPLGYLGLPGVSPFPGVDPSFVQGMAVLPDDLMTVYKQQTELLKEREKQLKTTTTTTTTKRGSRSPPSSALSPSSSGARNHVTHTSPPPPAALGLQSSLPGTHTDSPSPGATAGSQASSSSQPHDQAPPGDYSPSALPASSAAAIVSSTSSVSTNGNSRKRPRNFPDAEKDEAYWERRRKNNDAAKRSRDARRAKEDEIAIRAALLEQENLRLRVEVATLKTETARLRCLLYKT